MIIEYKFKNYRSFKDTVEFSLLAPPTKVKNRFPNNYVNFNNGYNVLKTIAIVGENAGGKSNFVKSLQYFKNIVLSNEPVRSYKNEVNSCFAQSDDPIECDTTQSFEITVVDDQNVIYKYSIVFDYLGIITEQLEVNKKKNSEFELIFAVKRKEVKRDSKSKINLLFAIKTGYNEKDIERIISETSTSSKRLSSMVSLFSIVGEPYSVSFVSWLREKLNVERSDYSLNVLKSLSDEEEDKEIMNDPRLYSIFRMIDYSITEIEISEEDSYNKTRVIRELDDGSRFKRELKDESSGIKEFFPLAIQLFKVVYLDKTIVVDEMDRVLNPVLSDRIISFVNGSVHKGQFIFTTHNALHLNLKTYMKEQIYFVTKDIHTLFSEMYSLADFPDVRYETTKVYEFYMKGILGGTANE